MGIREQIIDIGSGTEKVLRAVLDYRSHPELKLQTGYVRYDNNRVPVWRPYEPAEVGLEAKWRGGLWRNVYTLRMIHMPNRKHIFYEVSELEVEGVTAPLPSVEAVITYSLREHLKGFS